MIFQTLIDFLNKFLELGVPVIAPSLLFVLALMFRVPLSRALRAAITYGIGFVGIFMVLDMMLASIANASNLLVERTGLKLEIIDVGWPVDTAISFGVPPFATVFLGAIILNLVLFALKWTKTLDIDFHNYYQWVVIASVVYFATGNLVAATIVGLVNFVITLKIADWTARDIEEWWELPGVSIPHMNSMGWWPFALVINWVIDRIPGIKKIRIDVHNLQEKVGILGEPMVIGVIFGLVMGVAAGMPAGDVLNLAIKLGASMVLMPRMISLLMEGLVPIFQAARSFVLERFPGYDFYIGLDAAVLVGKSEVLVNGILMIPVILALAFLIPGNKVMPFADLSVMSFFCLAAVGVNRGNLFRGFLIGAIMCAMMLFGCSAIAPTITAMGQAAGFQTDVTGLYTTIEGGSLFGAQLINMPIFPIIQKNIAFFSNGWAIAGMSVVLGAIALVLFKNLFAIKYTASDLTPERIEELYPMGL